MIWRQGEWSRVLAIMLASLLLGGGGVFVLARVLDRTNDNRSLILKVRAIQAREIEGRRIASTATCAIGGAVADAGRKVINSGGLAQQLPAALRRLRYSSAKRRKVLADAARFQQALERMGYFSKEVRDAMSAVAADAYEHDIRERVQTITGRADLVTDDGALDCEKLRRIG